MENKYYTPSSKEELYFGMEVEFLNIHPYPPAEPYWFESMIYPYFYEDYEQQIVASIPNDRIRIKCLSQSDIESFGFEFKEYNEMAQKTIYEKVWNAGLCPIVYRLTTYSSDEDGTHVHINIHACDRFSGIIKNKSELAILLKMLDVDDLNSKY